MNHGINQRKFGRRTSHRKAMLANMAVSLLEHERITTTLAKAKDIRRVVEKLVTKGKSGTLHDRRQVVSKVGSGNKKTVKKLFDELAPRFKDRNGGYTRIIRKSAQRSGDSAEMAVIEFVDYVLPAKKEKVDKKADKTAKADSGKIETKKVTVKTDAAKDKKATKAASAGAAPSPQKRKAAPRSK